MNLQASSWLCLSSHDVQVEALRKAATSVWVHATPASCRACLQSLAGHCSHMMMAAAEPGVEHLFLQDTRLWQGWLL